VLSARESSQVISQVASKLEENMPRNKKTLVRMKRIEIAGGYNEPGIPGEPLAVEGIDGNTRKPHRER
jgi:hypothetical protein